MAFFRTINFTEPLPTIEGDGLLLRTPQMTDYEEWSALREASHDFLVPWEPTWPDDDLTRSAFRRRIKRYSEDLRSDQGYAFLIVRYSDGALVGGLTLGQYPPRRRPGLQPRLLDGPAFRAPGLYDGGGPRRHSLCLRDTPAAPHRGRLHPDQCRLDQAS